MEAAAMFKFKLPFLIAALAVSVLCSRAALAHGVPEQNTPRANAVLAKAPSAVSIRFDSNLEPIFSKLIVKDAAGRQVSEGNGNVDPSNAKILTTRLTSAAKGRYHVYWSAVSRDGHRTHGDYIFTVE
jgi:hypothetical protein